MQGADFAMGELCRFIRDLRSEAALVRYLQCLDRLQGVAIASSCAGVCLALNPMPLRQAHPCSSS